MQSKLNPFCCHVKLAAVIKSVHVEFDMLDLVGEMQRIQQQSCKMKSVPMLSLLCWTWLAMASKNSWIASS